MESVSANSNGVASVCVCLCSLYGVCLMDGEQRRRQQQHQDGVMGIVLLVAVIAVFTFNSQKVQGQIVVTLS